MEPITAQIIIAFSFGVTFVAALIILAIRFPEPTSFQYNVFRIVLSLAAAGAAAMIPGFINIEVNPTTGLLIRAGGAIAVFVVVFFFNPAQLAAQSEVSSPEPSQLPNADSQDPIEGKDIETLKQELISLSKSAKSILSMLGSKPGGLYPADLVESGLTRREIIYICKELQAKGIIAVEYVTDYLYRISPSVLKKLGSDYKSFFEKLLEH